MKLLLFLMCLSLPTLAETMTVALFEDHENYLKYSRAYKVNWELFELAAQSEGISLKAEPYLWARAINSLKRSEIDAVIGAYFSEERREFAHFSYPMALDRIYLYANKQENLSLFELKSPSTLVGVTSNSIGDTLAAVLKFPNVYRKSSSEQVFELLVNGRLDYAIFSESVANKHCTLSLQSNPRETCLVPVALPVKTNAFHTIYSKTSRLKIIAKRIDTAIDVLIADNKVKPIFLNSGYTDDEYNQWLTMKLKSE